MKCCECNDDKHIMVLKTYENNILKDTVISCPAHMLIKMVATYEHTIKKFPAEGVRMKKEIKEEMKKLNDKPKEEDKS